MFEILKNNCKKGKNCLYNLKYKKIFIKTKWYKKTWNSYGDSITYQALWQPKVNNALGLKYNNYGIGGSTIAVIPDNNTTNPMCTDERINALNINSDIILIMGGINDWAQNVPLGQIGSTDITTFYGALEIMIRKLSVKFQPKKLIFMTPMFAKLPNRYNFNDKVGIKNNLGLIVTDYAIVIIQLCKIYNIQYIDTNSQLKWNSSNILTYTNDGIHPNQRGGDEIANIVINYLVNI
jgi:lysophospholipase L1-like esterase